MSKPEHPALESLLAFDVRPLLKSPGRYDVLPQGRAAGQTIEAAIPALEALLADRTAKGERIAELKQRLQDALDEREELLAALENIRDAYWTGLWFSEADKAIAKAKGES